MILIAAGRGKIGSLVCIASMRTSNNPLLLDNLHSSAAIVAEKQLDWRIRHLYSQMWAVARKWEMARRNAAQSSGIRQTHNLCVSLTY